MESATARESTTIGPGREQASSSTTPAAMLETIGLRNRRPIEKLTSEV